MNANSKRGNKDLLTVVSLFAGAGGLDIGVCRTKKVGRLFSTDSHKVFLQTIVENMPTHFPKVRHSHLVADAIDLTGPMIRKSLGTINVDLVIGGPPCDDFTSTGRKRGAQGDKAPLIFQFARLVGELQPRAFLFENVPNLKKMCGRALDALNKQFKSYNYWLRESILDASAYGVPSIRKRIFIAGFKDIDAANLFQFPEPLYVGPSKQQTLFVGARVPPTLVTVGQVLRDLPDVTCPGAKKFLNHTGRMHRPETIEHLKTVPQGVAVRKSYRYRAPWDALCRSLTAGVDDATKSYIHPIYDREMSVREYARIHGFPDSWAFSGNHHNGIKQVANAVPVLLSSAVLRSVVTALE